MKFRTQYGLNFTDEIIVDLFAGGGGASTGLEIGLQRPVTIAINHNPKAISMHTVNHPHAEHFVQDVFAVDPRTATRGRPVGWLHASPDCTHHSQAAGGQPRKKEIRDLSWVVLRWAGTVRPRVISMENVKQIRQWGPLIAKRDAATGRVIKLDRTVAAPGERVPREQQYLVPDPKRRGRTWRHFIDALQRLGYVVEHRIIKAADHGAPTTRERLFLLARCDGQPIVWPAPTHAEKPGRTLKRWRTAAECIDWSIPCPSIFTRKKPLADATMRRIATGIRREVLGRKHPFLVEIANWSRNGVHATDQPLNTVTAWPRGGAFSVVSPTLVKFRFDAAGGAIDQPLPTITSGGNCARPAGAAHAMGIATAFLAQMNGGFNVTHSRDCREPLSTITNTGSQQQLVTAHLAHLRNNCDGRDCRDPLQTISAGGQHHAIVECTLSPEHEAGATRVAAFLMRYYSEGGQWGSLHDPLATVTTKDRVALVTVTIQGAPYVIVDIGLRMLKPRELFRAQGFPDTYVIEYGAAGEKFSASDQVHFVGNSVSPPPMAAIAAANDPWRSMAMEVAA